MRRFFAASLALAAIGIASSAEAQQALNIRESEGTVAETVERLETAIEARGASIVASIDHAENATTIGSTIPAATVVIFGNPALGTPLIAENPEIALDLPQRILVWDDGGTTRIGYHDPAGLAERYGIDPRADTISAMAGAMDGLAGEAAQASR